MQFTCTKENLAYALNLVNGITGKHANLPILSHVLFQVTESGVEIAATNLEIAIKAHLRAKIDSTGSFTVPGKTLTEFVNLLSGDQVQISLQENELLVEGGRSKTKIKGMPAEEFPVIPEFIDGKSFVIHRDLFKEALSEVIFSASKTEIRPEMSGIYFGSSVYGYEGLTLASTDSYRLSEKRVPLVQGVGEEISWIVPARTAAEFIRLLSLTAGKEEKENNVRFLIGGNQICLRYDAFEITSRVIAGRYPDYRQIIPKEFKTTAMFSKSQLVSSIKAASLFATLGVNAVLVKLNPGAQSADLSSTSTQAGEYSTTLDIQGEGSENSIVLNHRYLLDGLQHMESEEVLLQMNGSDAPCLLKPKDDSSYLYLIMPIRQ